jgi:hypothetical protein
MAKTGQELRQAVALIKSGDLIAARTLLSRFLTDHPTNDHAWVLMAAAVDTDELRSDCLNEALKHNPRNETARKALDRMVRQGRISMSQIPSNAEIASPRLTLQAVVSILGALALGVFMIVIAFGPFGPGSDPQGEYRLVFWLFLIVGALSVLLAIGLVIGTTSLLTHPPSADERRAMAARARRSRTAPAMTLGGGVIGGVLGAIASELIGQSLPDDDY